MIRVNREKCTGCGECKEICSFGAINIEGNIPVFEDNCVFCGICSKKCPEQAIEISEKTKEITLNDDYKGIWVIGEIDRNRNLSKVTLELLSEARKLAASKKENVEAVIIGKTIPEKIIKIISRTACNKILQLDCDGSRYNADLFTEALFQAAKERKPEIILFPATVNGRDLAPRVACRLKTGLTADCTGLDLDEDGNLIQIRPTYGGSIMASIVTPNNRPQIASIRPNVMQVILAEQRKIDVEKMVVNSSIETHRTEWIEIINKKVIYPDISEANVVIVGGYGMESKENFKLIYKIASLINASPGATRKSVDEGWALEEIQVGQTGKTVAPDIYIACGVSGALQHTIGMKRSKKIIAINQDPAAPIFSMCDVAILGNASDILQEMYEYLVKE